jgi:hypothetical protein
VRKATVPTTAAELLRSHNSNHSTIPNRWAAVRAAAEVVAVKEAARDNSKASGDNTAIAITGTTDDADAISGGAAGSAAAVVVRAAADKDSRALRAESRTSAHHSLR